MPQKREVPLTYSTHAKNEKIRVVKFHNRQYPEYYRHNLDTASKF